MLIAEGVTAVIRPAQHGLGIGALAVIQSDARLAVQLQAVVRGALEIVLS